MGTGRHEEPSDGAEPGPGATEPITLTDPDGAVTLVAPWSTWTREQMRAPGGEPALVTRLDQGQLWFSSGRRRSPWRHEVHIGRVVVSAPAGRFHVTAEPDGGATVDCLAGRTRVQAGLQDPVVLEAEQTAAVASDGDTLVVLDNAGSRAGTGLGAGTAGAAAAAAAVRADAGLTPADPAAPGVEPGADAAEPAEEAVPVSAAPARRSSRLPELVAVAALLAVLVAAVVVFSRGTDPVDEVVAPVRSSTTTSEASTTTVPTTTPSTTAPSTTAPSTTAPSTTAPSTTAAPAPTVPASATGRLAACRRADGGVLATIDVSLRSGGPGQFTVGVGLVDRSGQMFAQGEAQTEVIEQGASAPVDVLVSVPGAVSGSCQLLGVEAS